MDVTKELMEKFIDGLESKSKTVKSTCKDMAADAAYSLEDKHGAFYDAGEYLVEGFADGIGNSAYKAKTAAEAMALAAKSKRPALRFCPAAKPKEPIADLTADTLLTIPLTFG